MADNRCRILIFTQNDWFFHLHFLALGQALADTGAEVSLACLVDEHGERLEAAGLRVLALSSLDVRSLGLKAQAKTVVELVRLIRREQPDMVLTISPKPAVLGSFAAKLAGVPSILSLMTGLGFLFAGENERLQTLRRVVLGALKWAHTGAGSRILFQNSMDRELLIKSGVIPGSKAPLVGGVGTDLDKFKPGPRKNEVPVIVFGARMIRDKGVLDLVEAAHILHEQGLRFRVLLCGDPDPGNPNSLTTDELVEIHEERFVDWLGHVSDIERILAGADIACLPTYYREGMPKFLLDSAAAGLPLVTTNAPGCTDVVTHGENGLIVPQRSPVALADALRQLIVDRDRRQAMGRASRKRAEAEFSADAFVERVFAVFDDAAVAAGRPGCVFSTR
ncbi:glycosyltransferase family 4 protein [bacterium]|nr:glycosyltransferase family 4 protein [bacterium]